jgi:predicted RND superfamily exporter protein
VASHKGLESLGRVLTLGVTTCTITSLVFLPAVLTWLRPGAEDADEDAVEPGADEEPLVEDDPDRLAA